MAATRWVRWTVVCSSFVVLALGSGVALAERTRCPPGSRPSLSGCSEIAERARMRERPDATRSKIEPRLRTPELSPELHRHPPHALERPKRRLLLEELARLEQLLRMTHEKSPDRMQLVRRLAEGYAELAAQAERDRIRAALEVEAAEREERIRSKSKPAQRKSVYPTRL